MPGCLFSEMQEGRCPPEIAGCHRGKRKTRMVPPDIDDFRLSDFMVDVAFSPGMTYQEALVMAMKTEDKVMSL
ncbi:MAG: hypothetical protein R2860_15600 [Desulfobacterales bacterium]